MSVALSRSWLTSLAAVIALVLLPGACGAYAPPPDSPLARREHPRVFLNRAELPALQARLAGPMRQQYQAFVSHLDGLMGSTGDDIYHVSNYAFVYRVGVIPGITYEHPLAAYAERAKRGLAGTSAAYVLATGYDWLYDALTPAERAELAGRLASSATPSANTNPLDDGEILARSAYVLAGLAIWGDGLNDEEANKRVDAYRTLILETGLALHNLLAADDGGWSQGLDYAAHGPRGNVTALLRVMDGWRTANGLSKQEVFGGLAASVLRYYPQWVAYNVFPEAQPSKDMPDGYLYRLYKTHHMPAGLQAFRHAANYAQLNALRHLAEVDGGMASLAQWLTDTRFGNTGVTGVDGTREALFAQFLFGRPVTPQSPSQLGLPLTKKFDGLGWVVMRTSWDDPNATMVTFTAAPWSRAVGAYTNMDQGSFTINRRGPLVINSGEAVHHGYANSTWAANTMIFPDPDDATVGTAKYHDLGGQRSSGNPELKVPSQLVGGSAFDIGGIKRFQEASAQAGLPFDYVFADLTRAYSSTAFRDYHNVAKVRNFTRQFVYFRKTGAAASDFVVVFDRAETTEAKFEKRWLLHTSGDPTIDGTVVPEGPGRWSYTGASLVTQENTAYGSSGKVFVSVLLPQSRKVFKVGGAPDGQSPFGASGFAFVDPYGVQDPSTKNTAKLDRLQYVGTHRVEVVSTSGAADDNFLHVFEVSDAGKAVPAEVALLGGGVGLVGARFGGRIVVFRRSEGMTLGGEVTVDRPGTYEVLVCDLEPGRQYVVGGQHTAFASGAGVLYGTVTVSSAGSRLTIEATGIMAARPEAPRNLKFQQ